MSDLGRVGAHGFDGVCHVWLHAPVRHPLRGGGEVTPSAFARKRSKLKGYKDFHLKAEARIYMNT